MNIEGFPGITSDKNNLAPWVEVRSEKFRGVAKNFYLMPVGVLLAIYKANERQDGSDILMLLDAAEACFDAEDFERLNNLVVNDFLNTIQQWVDVSYPQS
jgi:hypothetical protein